MCTSHIRYKTIKPASLITFVGDLMPTIHMQCTDMGMIRKYAFVVRCGHLFSFNGPTLTRTCQCNQRFRHLSVPVKRNGLSILEC